MTLTKKKQEPQINFLVPRPEAVKIDGKLFYSEGDQSWNIIRLKKDVLKEFPQLKEKRSSFKYTMIVSRSKEEIKRALLDAEQLGGIPILLFFNKEEVIENSSL